MADVAGCQIVENPFDVSIRKRVKLRALFFGSRSRCRTFLNLFKRVDICAALIQNRDFKTAESCLTRSHLLEPGSPLVQTELAILQLATGQTNAALSHLKEALRLNPGDKRATALLNALSAAGAPQPPAP